MMRRNPPRRWTAAADELIAAHAALFRGCKTTFLSRKMSDNYPENWLRSPLHPEDAIYQKKKKKKKGKKGQERGGGGANKRKVEGAAGDAKGRQKSAQGQG